MVKKLKKFFWLCSGADIDTLNQCPTESTKYAGIGATIFFTGVFAALAASYALYTVFDNIYAAIAFGIVWGLMIFNLDRYIVSSMRKRKKRSAELLMATPRIILAIIISIVIAKPLELKIFEKEINSEIALMQQEDMQHKIKVIESQFAYDFEKLENDIAALKQEVLNKEQKRDELQQIAQQEADGTGGTGQRNAGPIYKIKKADADQANEELQTLKQKNNELIDARLAAIDSLQNQMAQSINVLEKASLTGMASRLEALERIEKKSEAIYWASWFIMLLFVAVETAPVLVKLMSPEGPYDHLMKADHHKYRTDQYEYMARYNAQARKKKAKLTAEEQAYLEEQLDIGLQDS